MSERLTVENDAIWEAGVRQAIEWLQAGYPYGDMPEWRQSGVDWIADRLSDHLASHGSLTPTPTEEAPDARA